MKKLYFAAILLLVFSCGKSGGPDARITKYSGDVKINGKAVAGSGQAVRYGDVITTGKASACTMIVGEKNIFSLRADTKLVFNVSGKDNQILLERGWLACVARKLFTSTGTFIVKTPTMVASIRGTSFCGKVENPENTYFCVCNGRIELKKEPGVPGEVVEAPHHVARRFVRQKDGSLLIDKNPGVLYHNDQGLVDLAKQINESVDWSRPDQK